MIANVFVLICELKYNIIYFEYYLINMIKRDENTKILK